ncbi:Peptidyl-prolyl cis-trans isomerase FKBP13 [Chlorella vulgaris]
MQQAALLKNPAVPVSPWRAASRHRRPAVAAQCPQGVQAAVAVQRRAVLLGTATAFALPVAAALAANECTDFQTAPSGIQWCEVVEGTGEPPVKGARIRAHYRGSLESGAVFDSSYERGRPLIFQVGVGQVIKGWDMGILGAEGLPAMRAGGKRVLIIPSSLAYGERGAGGVIPPGATLRFLVEYLGKQGASVLALLPSAVEGHGYLAQPAARNVLANSDYCPQCLSAGGPATVYGAASFPNGAHGLCGDLAAGPLRHEAGGALWTGRPTAVLREGSVVYLNVTVTAFHKGRFEFRICRVDGTDVASEKAQLTEACLDQHALVQANVPGAQAPGDRYYHLGSNDQPSYTMPYQLPSGLSCDGTTSKCVLQWYWITGNTCNPPGEPAPYRSPQLPDCGTGGSPPEEFWNCADVLITPGDFTPLPPAPPALPSPRPPPIVASPPLPPSPAPGTPDSGDSSSPCPSGDAACYCRWQGRDGMFADAQAGCRSYFQCFGPSAYYRSCGRQLLFSDQHQYCDWPENVKCDTAAPTPSPATSPSPPAAAPPSPQGLPPSPSLLSPPSPSPLPPPAKRPSPPAPSPAPPPPLLRPSPPPPSPKPRPPPPSPKPRPPPPSPKPRPPPPSPRPSPPPAGPSSAPMPASTFCTGKAAGFYADPRSACRGYYRCEPPSSAWYFTCAGSLVFNEATKACDWPTNVQCPVAVATSATRKVGRRLRG